MTIAPHHPPVDSRTAGIGNAPAVEVRPVVTLAEYHACVALQEAVWGEGFDRVPASLLQVATYVGGLCLGAFSPEGRLDGFVFGLAGTIEGQAAHWSHLLAVREGARNLGIGRLLKEHQRMALASRGVSRMYWTFDPLIARNAHLNLNILAARVVRYVPDMYGTTHSPLHHGLATDRLVVSCATAAGPLRGPASAFTAAPLLTHAPRETDAIVLPAGLRPPRLRIEVPADFQQLIADSPAAASGWQQSLRAHFQWALGAGYVVSGLQRDPASSRSFYTLQDAAEGPT